MRVVPFFLAIILLGWGSFVSVGVAAPFDDSVIKQSRSGICHDPSSPYYQRTKNFTAYDSLRACLANGGRLPKGHRPAVQPQQTQQPQDKDYDRSAFGRWLDDDNDCMNTRHELLQQLSTRSVSYSQDGCRVTRGRWLDPYTDRTFLSSSDLDIDHLVPLKWAWDNGANTWDDEKRQRFANDPVNLFAVDNGTNRSKGAQGPQQWLPPNARFHCQYLTRYQRVLKIYDFTNTVQQQVAQQREQICRSDAVAGRTWP
ncbi:uncharacterized protein DUF1524 [Idiomarina fontislapidosi]|uniref:HNH endonuclease n=1 Tax=Idiomarina fontislapidosi TaxID=263723 RepID=A0A432YB61_9GAMM|nr:HNH endonuclease family protein [Idiomarina fontislapidosi]PYE35212.1 uncharacterized protein DUF1524 [Idiomarina fontislapidosi]RUO58106.1 HNH endonuclease [Idiomarina fontislapidosi]